jgi:hypothetical protein
MLQLVRHLSRPVRAVLPALASALIVAAASRPASAQVATFDDVASEDGPAPGYAVPGLVWTNWLTLNADGDIGRGAADCLVSGTSCGYNGFGTRASITGATPFTFNSGYFMAWYNGFAGGFGAPVSLTVNGYFGAALLGSRTVELNPHGAQLLTFDYAGVDRVDFIPNDNQGETWYLADDLAFNGVTVTPEPGSLVLLASGLVGILGLVRRRRSRSSRASYRRAAAS